jgi:hypothetical protein
MLESILDIGRSAVKAVSGFFKSDTFDVARNVMDGVRTVTDTLKGVAGRMDQSPPIGLVDPNQNLSQFKIQGTSRSRAGVSSFSDVQEENYYKYAQAQNLVRYLYAAKSRYKNMTKGKS